MRYDDRGFFVALIVGVGLIFLSATISVRDRYFRNMMFQSTTAFYFIYVSLSGYFVHLQTLESYSVVLLDDSGDGTVFLSNIIPVAALALLAALSAVYFPPKFRSSGVKLPTLSNRDVITTFVLAGLVRSVLVFGFLLFLSLLSLDLAYLEESRSSGVQNLWDFEKSDFTLRFVLGYSVLPIFSVFLLFRTISTITRMCVGDLVKYRRDKLNRLARRYSASKKRDRFESDKELR